MRSKWRQRPSTIPFAPSHHPFPAKSISPSTVTASSIQFRQRWEKPYEYLPTGKKAYLDEQDVVTFLDPQVLASCNPAAYLWKKIDDIPPETRYQLLRLLEPRLISSAWEIAGTRYAYPNLTKRSASKLLCTNDHGVTSLEYYHYRTSGGPMPISWINSFQKAIFSSTDGNIYGRFIGGSFLTGLANSFSPLYFTVRQLKEVMPTEQPSDLAYVFGDGLFDLQEYPEGFPRPGGCVRSPSGARCFCWASWQEGNKLQQVPQKLCSDILRVKDYSALRENQ